MVEVKPTWILFVPGFLTFRFNLCGKTTVSLLLLLPLSYHLWKIKKSCQRWACPVTTGSLWLQAKSCISSPLHLHQIPGRNQIYQQEASPCCEWMDQFKQNDSCNTLPGHSGKSGGLSAPPLNWHSSNDLLLSSVYVLYFTHKKN
jgi:hypothetical protein